MDNLRAIALMVAGMACFAMEDTAIKFLSDDVPLWQIFWIFGGVGSAAFATVLARKRLAFFGPAFRHPLVLLRNAGDIVASVGFVTALSLVPLSLATAILQATPLAITAGAAIFLGETVGWRRWVAVMLGLVGILVILDPFGADFRAEALFAVLGVAGLMVRDLATRRIPEGIATHQLAFWGYAGFLVSGAILMPFDPRIVALDGAAAGIGAVGAVVGAAGYWALTSAMRMGEVSAVIPFRYTRLIFAMALGVLLLGERPDATTLAGAGLVVATGLYTVLRERKLAIDRRRAAPNLSRPSKSR